MRTIEDTISAAIKMQLEEIEVARDFLIDDFEGNLEKLLFIWDYIWTKHPRKESSGYYWTFYHFDMYTIRKDLRDNEFFQCILDSPIKMCFSLCKMDFPELLNGWDHTHTCFYVNGAFIVCASRPYTSLREAYYEAIYNWYFYGLHTDDIE